MRITKNMIGNWSIIWKVLLFIIVTVAAGTTLYASINYRVDSNSKSINHIEKQNVERDSKMEDFGEVMIRQEVQFKYISEALERIEEKIEKEHN